MAGTAELRDQSGNERGPTAYRVRLTSDGAGELDVTLEYPFVAGALMMVILDTLTPSPAMGVGEQITAFDGLASSVGNDIESLLPVGVSQQTVAAGFRRVLVAALNNRVFCGGPIRFKGTSLGASLVVDFILYIRP